MDLESASKVVWFVVRFGSSLVGYCREETSAAIQVYVNEYMGSGGCVGVFELKKFGLYFSWPNQILTDLLK